MIKHLVLWRLNGETADQRRAQAREIKQVLEALNGRIPGLKHLEVGIDFTCSERSAHVALCAELESRAALEVYQNFPEHVAAKKVVAAATADAIAADYEI